MFATKFMDHKEYPKLLKAIGDHSLRMIIKDCQEAIEAFPENPNCGYYQDEINYCSSELYKRRSKRQLGALRGLFLFSASDYE